MDKPKKKTLSIGKTRRPMDNEMERAVQLVYVGGADDCLEDAVTLLGWIRPEDPSQWADLQDCYMRTVDMAVAQVRRAQHALRKLEKELSAQAIETQQKIVSA